MKLRAVVAKGYQALRSGSAAAAAAAGSNAGRDSTDLSPTLAPSVGAPYLWQKVCRRVRGGRAGVADLF